MKRLEGSHDGCHRFAAETRGPQPNGGLERFARSYVSAGAVIAYRLVHYVEGGNIHVYRSGKGILEAKGWVERFEVRISLDDTHTMTTVGTGAGFEWPHRNELW